MDYLNKVDTIKIIDATCGKGKTSWAIQYMNEADPSEKFLFITPFLTEVERIKEGVQQRKFSEPSIGKGNESKFSNLKQLLNKGENIVSTHKLFSRLDKEAYAIIKAQNYTLILDEVMDVIEQIPIAPDDIKILLNSKTSEGTSYISVDEQGFIKWNNKDYNGKFYKDIQLKAYSNSLMMYKDTAIFSVFPIQAFSSFRNVFVLTYMFYGQTQRYYFEMFNIKYKFHSTRFNNEKGKYELIDYVRPSQENVEHLKKNIKIYNKLPKDKKDLNAIGEDEWAFSSSWIRRKLAEGDEFPKKVIKNVYNFYHNKCNTKINKIMWTCVMDFQKDLEHERLTKQFVAVTSRATNDYVDRETLIYLSNRYMNPILKGFFESHNVKVLDEDLWALSELLQWLFRSAIRQGNEINIYIPSSRMRGLLAKYLKGELISSFEKLVEGVFSKSSISTND